MRKRFFRVLLWTLGSLAMLVAGLAIYVSIVSTVDEPSQENTDCLTWQRTELDSNFYALKNNWLRRSESGLYEMYVEGEPFERGVVIGKLTKELAQRQERVFIKQIRQIIPSDFKLNFLKYFVGWFNRHLNENIPKEFQDEIYGLSTEASHQFDYIAPPYHRILNYHAAHDIGHALQNMSLVGCTSFALWGDKTEDGNLLVARNFDFYVGDEFAEKKIIAFYNPAKGHKFMMITFGGMIGALSGMNDQGLTVTINAAKSNIPFASAMPVSLVAREILQYASTIQEAYSVAARRKMFVSESFLIGSAKDKRAAIVEKSAEMIGLFETTNNQIISTNHFQSKTLGSTLLNQEHMLTSASVYRWKRVDEILQTEPKNSIEKIVTVLRNRSGLTNADIGLGNEKAINQLIAHHSVIFKPAEQKVWISTAPWQLGKYVCYDLNTIFKLKLDRNREIYDSTLTVSSDPFLLTREYHDFVKFAQYRFPFQSRADVQPDSLVQWNPNSYLSFMLAGDACFLKNDFVKAHQYYEIGLTKEIATRQEREYMKAQLEKCSQK